MNLIIMKAGYPPIVIKNETKEDYYRTLTKADEGNLSDLLELCHNEMKNSLELMLDVIAKTFHPKNQN